MRILAAGAVLLLAGCGGAGEGGDADGAASTNQIERLSTPKEEKGDRRASVRLQPITPADLASEGMVGAGCDFRREGHVLLASVGSDAIVRIGGDIRHLIHSAPVGPTGGFFEDRQLSISVGRTDDNDTSTNAAAGWPARITISNRRAEVRRELQGIWTCGA